MNIAGFQPLSLSDYPGKLAAVIFTKGCNYRCGFCHNSSLIPFTTHETEESSAFTSHSQVFSYLNRRKGKLNALVISGGEPTLQKRFIPFIKQVKALGYEIKLDTNGSQPHVLRELIETETVDYIAMDIKGPLEKYQTIVNVPFFPQAIEESIRLIMDSPTIDYEFRTTVVKRQLTPEDIKNCAKLIRGAKRYYLQKFVPNDPLDHTFYEEETYSGSEFSKIIETISHLVKECSFR